MDLYKCEVQACLLMPVPGGTVRQDQRTCLTMTKELPSLPNWLVETGSTAVAKECAGAFWKSVRVE